jgi:hypothetical protein
LTHLSETTADGANLDEASKAPSQSQRMSGAQGNVRIAPTFRAILHKEKYLSSPEGSRKPTAGTIAPIMLSSRDRFSTLTE